MTEPTLPEICRDLVDHYALGRPVSASEEVMMDAYEDAIRGGAALPEIRRMLKQLGPSYEVRFHQRVSAASSPRPNKI